MALAQKKKENEEEQKRIEQHTAALAADIKQIQKENEVAKRKLQAAGKQVYKGGSNSLASQLPKRPASANAAGGTADSGSSSGSGSGSSANKAAVTAKSTGAEEKSSLNKSTSDVAHGTAPSVAAVLVTLLSVVMAVCV